MDIAKRIASALGVEVVFTSYPLEQVVTGNWGGRFDIAMQHLAITDERRSVLDFSTPYAFDPTQLIVDIGTGPSRRHRCQRHVVRRTGIAGRGLVERHPAHHRPAARRPRRRRRSVTLQPAANDDECIVSVGSGPPDATGLTGGLVSLDGGDQGDRCRGTHRPPG